MKVEESKKYNREHIIIVTTEFNLYFSEDEEENGIEIPQKLIEKEVRNQIKQGNYDVQEESID